jgi:PHD/YefM family antitoxin component YafN of YafNO toxin-antitoxin module
MCEDDLPHIEDLPRRTAADVRRKFADVMREIHKKGVVAITRHDKIEVVIMDGGEYRRRTAKLPTEARRQALLAELAAEFDQRLASLRKSEAREQVDAIMDADGKTKRRPKAGDF